MPETNRSTEIELREIDASEILGKIQRREQVIYDHAIINGELDFAILEESHIVSPISITNSQFKGPVYFGKIFYADTDFKHALFSENVRGIPTFTKNANFDEAVFMKDAFFNKVVFEGHANFRGAEFGYAGFEGAKFNWEARFDGANIKGYAIFSDAVFIRDARFSGATFGRENPPFRYYVAAFEKATFNSKAQFSNTKFIGDASFNEAMFRKGTDFSEAMFSKNADFDESKFEGDDLTFRNAIFNKPGVQEDACRRAKIVLAKTGNRDEEEYHFYREMEAKRIRKGIRDNSGLSLVDLVDCLKTDTWSFWRFFFHDVIEWIFVQMMFGYGVHFERLIASWAVIVLLFAVLYYQGGAISGAVWWFDDLKISFGTAIAPGYITAIINAGNSTGGYKITSGYYQVAAMVETVLGTFLWAGFIATFAKKYMR